MSGKVKIIKRPYSVVPDDILQDKRLSTETRLILAWLLGRPVEWDVYVWQVIKALGLSEYRWKKSRREMEKFGYMKVVRHKNSDGTFRWEFSVTDTPVCTKNAINENFTDGQATDGEVTDISTQSHQYKQNTSPPYPLPGSLQISEACVEEARQRFQGYSVEALEDEWRVAIDEKGEPPKFPDKAFLAWAARYVENHPLPYGEKL